MCQEYNSGTGQILIAMSNQQVIDDPSAHNGAYWIKYSGGDSGRSVTIEVTCDKSKAGQPTQWVVQNTPPSLDYFFQASTALACNPKNEPSGTPTPSGKPKPSDKPNATVTATANVAGWAFFGAVVGGFFLYMVIGMIYKKVKLQSQGLDMVPNVEFWKNLPGLVKDGAMFTFTCGKAKPSGASYQAMP
jgi:hypothetical protein